MQLTPEQINDFLAKSVLESQIGAAVQASVKRAVESLSKTYNNPFDAVIRAAVVDLIRNEVNTTHRALLEATVKEKLQEALPQEVVSKLVEAAFEKLAHY